MTWVVTCVLMVGTCRHLVAVGRTTGYRDWCWTLVENARADKAGVGYGVTRTISRLICHVIATVLATFLAALATLSTITAVTCAVAWTKSGGFTAFTSVKPCQISQTQFIKGSAWKKGYVLGFFLRNYRLFVFRICNNFLQFQNKKLISKCSLLSIYKIVSRLFLRGHTKKPKFVQKAPNLFNKMFDSKLLLKVSKYRKEISKFPFEPKNKRKISALFFWR